MTKTITVSDETFDLIKDQLKTEESFDVSQLEDFIGKKLFIRTVTYHMVGEVESIVGNLFKLKNAAWIADSGRFHNAIVDGELDEVEPVCEAYLNISTIVDIFPWKHKLPLKQK